MGTGAEGRKMGKADLSKQADRNRAFLDAMIAGDLVRARDIARMLRPEDATPADCATWAALGFEQRPGPETERPGHEAVSRGRARNCERRPPW